MQLAGTGGVFVMTDSEEMASNALVGGLQFSLVYIKQIPFLTIENEYLQSFLRANRNIFPNIKALVRRRVWALSIQCKTSGIELSNCGGKFLESFRKFKADED